MNKRVLIAPNSYKECADSVEAAELFQSYLDNKDLTLISAPLSDGGDGFLKVCKHSFSLKQISFRIPSPCNSAISTEVGYDEDTLTVYIESASVLGLNLIPKDKRNPMNLSSAGMGELLIKIMREVSPEKIIIGIGGTATNDLGLGMLQKLGLAIRDAEGKNIEPIPQNFHQIQDVNWAPDINIPIELVIDVINPLLGTNGSTFVYGPQKGLDKNLLSEVDSQFKRLVNLFITKGCIKPSQNFSGAGGGLAAALQMFLNAKIKSSSEFILHDLKLGEYLDDCDYIITGEGKFDNQSFMGKGAGIIIGRTEKPVFLVCGVINFSDFKESIFPIQLIKYFKTNSDSIKFFNKGIEKASSEILSAIKFDC